MLNRRVCGIRFGILITVHNKYTLILRLWKCGTIAQLYYCIVDISARAGYWAGPRAYTLWKAGSWAKSIIKDIYWLTAGFKSAQDIYFYRADLKLDPEPTRTYTPLWSWVVACTSGHILWAGPWKLLIREILIIQHWSILLSTYTHIQT